MAARQHLVGHRPEGLYCPQGDCYLDPLKPVKTALITHAHSDHARPGSQVYHASVTCAPLLRTRLAGAEVIAHPWGEPFDLGDVRVSFHPAGHVLGSAQIRLEAAGVVTVFTGDYKRHSDPSCEAFELVPCDVFITEATFALPVYRWADPEVVLQEMVGWLAANRDAGYHSIVLAYSLGKAQRLLSSLLNRWHEPVWVHGSIDKINAAYRQAGVELPPTRPTQEWGQAEPSPGQLIIAPPAASTDKWFQQFRPFRVAGVSGWTAVRGINRRSGYHRGFTLSDHADWPGLIETVKATGAYKVWVTHGQCEVFARYLREREKLDAMALSSLYTGDTVEVIS